jgi:hypothetical protein
MGSGKKRFCYRFSQKIQREDISWPRLSLRG